MARPRWCNHIPPATTFVECGGQQHRVTWRKGKLVLEDHDVAAERTMLAFGGERPECLQVLQLWRNVYSWAMSTELFRQMQARLSPGALLAPGELGERNQLGLMLTWERAWHRSVHFSEHGRLLREHLRPRVVAPLRKHLTHWMRLHGCRRIAGVDVEVPRDDVTALEGRMDRVSVRATAKVGARWLVDVFARDLALADGAFVLDVEANEPGGAGVVVRAVRWEADGAGAFVPVAARARAVRGADGWALTWLDPGSATRP